MLAHLGGRRKFVVVTRSLCNVVVPAGKLEKDINSRIRALLGTRTTQHRAINDLFDKYKEHMTAFNISFFYSQISKYKLRLTDKQLSATAAILDSKKDFLLPTNAAIIVYAMQLYNNESAAKLVINSVRKKIEECNVEPFLSRDIALTLYGLRNMSNRSSNVRHLLRAMYPRIVECPDTMTAADVSAAFFGLRSMNTATSKDCSVTPILDALGSHLQGCPDSWPAWEIGNAVSGLQNMNSESASVRRVLNTFADIVEKGGYTLDSRTVCNMLLGLQSMSSNTREVRRLVEIIADRIDLSAADQYDSIAVKNSLFGMRCMDSKHEGVRLLVSKLSRKVIQCREVVAPRYLSSAISGLRYMSSDNIEVREMVSVVSIKLQEMVNASLQGQGDNMNMREVARMFTGLTNLSSEVSEVRQLLTVIDEVLENAKYEDIDTYQIVDIVASLSGMSPSCPEARTIIGKIAVLAKATSDKRPFSAIDIYKLMSGLHLMDTSSCDEVKELFRAIVEKSRTLTIAADVQKVRQKLLAELGENRVCAIDDGKGTICSEEEEVDNWINTLGLNSALPEMQKRNRG